MDKQEQVKEILNKVFNTIDGTECEECCSYATRGDGKSICEVDGELIDNRSSCASTEETIENTVKAIHALYTAVPDDLVEAVINLLDTNIDCTNCTSKYCSEHGLVHGHCVEKIKSLISLIQQAGRVSTLKEIAVIMASWHIQPTIFIRLPKDLRDIILDLQVKQAAANGCEAQFLD